MLESCVVAASTYPRGTPMNVKSITYGKRAIRLSLYDAIGEIQIDPVPLPSQQPLALFGVVAGLLRCR